MSRSLEMINIGRKKIIGLGISATYYMLDDNTGIKVFSRREKHTTPQAVRGSRSLELVFSEFGIMVTARERLGPIAPAPIKVAIAKVGKFYYPAIVMEHKVGSLLSKFCSDFVKTVKESEPIYSKSAKYKFEDMIISKAEAVAKKAGVILEDLHSGNIIIKQKPAKGKKIGIEFFIIDFGPHSEVTFANKFKAYKLKNVITFDYQTLVEELKDP